MSEDRPRLHSTATWSGETEEPGARGPRPSLPVEEPQHAIGTRYVLAEELGRGGMAVVRAAYDRQLARRVAVKLLRPDQRGNAGSARLVREAQALAQLRHPNVVTVFDAGAHDGQVFLAMELVEGESLRHWITAERRPWRDVVRMFIGAARGLIAAHHAGLVHRDFKPDNVLIDRDGTPRVADFGLARFMGSGEDVETTSHGDEPAASTEHEVALHNTVTRAGAVVGTPPYLAPEVMVGESADARSDQFSFGVSLAEALSGERPYPGNSLDELVQAIDRTKPRLDGVQPAWVRAVVERMLAREPGRRYPSMAAVVTALDRDPARRRRRLLLAGGGVVLAGAALAGAALLLADRGGEKRPSCALAGTPLDGVWDTPRRATLAASVGRSKLPYAPEIGRDLERSLDAYADAIRKGERAVCEADRLGEDPVTTQLRTDCLGRRRAELGSVIDVLLELDDQSLPRAPRAISRLGLVAECEDVAALRSVALTRGDAQAAATARELQEAVDRARILSHLGRYADAAAILEPLVPRAHALDHPATEADVLLGLGAAVEGLDKQPIAEAHMRAALLAAQRGHHDIMVARAAASLALNIGRLQRRPAEGRTWADLAIATSARLGRPGHAEAFAHFAAAVVAIGDHRADDAEREANLALEAGKAAGYDDVGMAEIINTLGGVSLDRGRFEEARARYQQARDLSAPHVGEDHPSMVVYDSNLASVATALGDYPKAIELRRRVLDARRRALGPSAPRVGDAYMILAQSLLAAGRAEEAIPEARQAVPILAAAGQDTPPALNARLTLASALLAAGQLDEATTLATAVEKATPGPAAATHRISAQVVLGNIALARQQPAAAAPHFDIAVALAVENGFTRVGPYGEALLGQAMIARSRGKRDVAAKLAREAHDVLTVAYGPSAPETRRAVAELAALQATPPLPDAP